MHYLTKIALAALTLALTIAVVTAQDQCPTIVQTAVDVLAEDCAGLERNQVCYGNGEIIVSAQPGASVMFEDPGDVDELANFESLTLSPLDEESGAWGIALMQVQADLPDTIPGQNVSVLLFGDVEITNAGDSMEAFYFRSGVGTADCAQAPDGILIQTPEGVGTVNLTINNVQIELGSTAYLTAEPEGLLVFALLEGEAAVTSIDQTVTLEAGQYTQMGMSLELTPVDTPSEPKDIEGNLELPELPLGALPQPITEDSGEDATADGVIIPRSGNWTSTQGDVVFTGSCPAALQQTLQNNVAAQDVAFVDFGGVPFDLESFLTTNVEEPILGGTYSNPEPNVFQYTVTEEGATFIYEVHLLSETELEFSLKFDFSAMGMDCAMTLPFFAQWTGE